ncbi:uncharacterized protein FIBRA_08946 [Fibroporia radiculosa]|uniref:Reverse transcriptase domain-containing protein n=1 Tax=Fibroporia radiculosa TaxID=599839 RepID=J4ICM3_9APHY|nr:uncharacterized protein FIBRA_08946 [Fibroporia radiculosa]CCM06661.1 predicted protein [Fibroporia radiculosa]
MHISAGMKFMLYKPPDESAIKSAYEDFKDRLRWRLIFDVKEANSNKDEESREEYDPDYEVPHTRKRAQKTYDYIECGLSAGDAYVAQYCGDIVPQIKARASNSGLVWLDTVRKYLHDNGLIVLATDKNLGSCVVTRTWFIEHTQLLLSDTTSYREISDAERQMILEKTHTEVGKAAAFASDVLRHDQLARFLRSKIPEDSRVESVVPGFYGIPKIHKFPVKMRPIVPCHSCAQGPAAKYVSKQLKALIESRPFVCKGTKQLAQRLSELVLDKASYSKYWLVTGDVVAFYPNIPLSYAIRLVTKMWQAHPAGGLNQSADQQHLFIMCMQLAMRRLITEFGGKTYEQIRGIAMGVACSPDIANLFGAWFEEHALLDGDGHWRDPRIVFYNRYIDDCFSIVRANSAADAVMILESAIHFEGCTIEWDASDLSVAFLDMSITIDPEGWVDWKPYRKARNHLERIPWASHHPNDVKKGTFLGEMSRLAVLCSRPSYYREALENLYDLYIARGYPGPLLRSWISHYRQTRWNSRFETPVARQENASVFVLKSSYNPVWEKFDAQGLGKVIVGTWEQELRDMHVLYSRIWGSTAAVAYEAVRTGTNTSQLMHQALLSQFGYGRVLNRAGRDSERAEVERLLVSGGSSPDPDPMDVDREEGEVQESTSQSGHYGDQGRRTPDDDRWGLRPQSPAPDPGPSSEESPGGGAQEAGQVALALLSNESHGCMVYTGRMSRGAPIEFLQVPDVLKLGYHRKRWIVSRKRGVNLGDRVNKWRKDDIKFADPDDVFRLADLGDDTQQ